MLTRRVTGEVLLRIQQHKEQVDGGTATTGGDRGRATGAGRLKQRDVASMEAEYTMLLPGQVYSPHSGWSAVAPPTHLCTDRRLP